MDIFLLIVTIVIVNITLLFLNSPQFKGSQGEKFVNKKFISQLNPLNYRLLNDIMLQNESDIGTTQIDHVIVSDFGVFCIETKSYSGWILGRESDKYWTQSINYQKYRFYNPLRQNYGHVKTLEKILSSLNISTPIYSFVIFTGAKKLKITGTDAVGCTRNIVGKIKSYSQVVLSNEDKDKIINTINQANIIDKNIRREHSRKIKRMRDVSPKVQTQVRHKYKKEYQYKHKKDNNFFNNSNFDSLFGNDDFNFGEPSKKNKKTRNLTSRTRFKKKYRRRYKKDDNFLNKDYFDF